MITINNDNNGCRKGEETVAFTDKQRAARHRGANNLTRAHPKRR